MPKGHPLTFPPEDLENIAGLYDDGLTITDVAKEYGTSYTGMRNAMLKAGIDMKHPNRKYTIDEHVFDQIDNEGAAYWLGFIYADGCVSKTFLQVRLSVKDEDHLLRLRDFLKSDSPIRYYEKSGYSQTKSAQLTVFGRHLSNRLRELGILAGRPDHAPTVKQVDPDVMSHFLRGFLDGDGAITKHHAVWFCGPEPLMEFIRRHMAEAVGRNPDITIVKHSTSDLYYLHYKGAFNAGIVADYLYEDATIYLPRKKDEFDSWPGEELYTERAKKGWITRRKNPNARMNQYR